MPDELVYAALLLHSAKKPISEENLRHIIQASGSQVSEDRIRALIASLDGINIDEAISKAVAMPLAGAAPAAEKKEEKKEEDVEKKAEEAAAGLAGLFG